MHDRILSPRGYGQSPCPFPEDISGFALFLDIDGTLLDIAPTPETVVVPAGLRDALKRLAERLDGALALVTGRPVGTVDDLFRLPSLAVCGLHGAEWRGPDGQVAHPETTTAFERARARLRDEAARLPGVLLEDKGAAIAAHYRLAPEQEERVRTLMAAIARDAGEGWMLQEGKRVVELRPRGRDKGDALATFMGREPFRGRRPLAIGDDVTDEAMFAAANRMDGLSIRVAAHDSQSLAPPSLALSRISTPSQVRAWIARVAA